MGEDFKSKESQSEMQRNIDAATQLQSIKSNTAGGKTFKARNVDMSMRPTLHPGDVLIIGGANPMKLKAGDMIYFRISGGEYRVRKVVRRLNEGAELRFTVTNEDGHEEQVADHQVLGLVMAAERRGEIVQFQKAALNIDTNAVMEKGLGFVQSAVNKISGLFKKSGD